MEILEGNGEIIIPLEQFKAHTKRGQLARSDAVNAQKRIKLKRVLRIENYPQPVENWPHVN